ncbi:predicted protein [Phaeodactylum tricornutum CCAP 1055/1]|jgi:hypothetical protein|uniref:Uncharacterized protein n=1 Tax=Phaeodactylum tricornutum (strain CCAP 1055/1) TaxID=556484 RepID=B7GCD6_PHATC|nr:predicted protein [Phaeodactylum tricornutum CCAP 1055/1]EEC43847.1 predicted protein [Phaeodactylum tricornutum CCAP 1055/1]|eukprot:XP_002184788.1 predicted protein [Phaeodactylum tricornutum CCAP 1055/1]
MNTFVAPQNLDTVVEKLADEAVDDECDILTVKQVAEFAVTVQRMGEPKRCESTTTVASSDSSQSSSTSGDRVMRLPTRNASFRLRGSRSDQLRPMPAVPERSQSMRLSSSSANGRSAVGSLLMQNDVGPLSRMSGIRQPPQRTVSSRNGTLPRIPARTMSTDSALRGVPRPTTSSLRGECRDPRINIQLERKESTHSLMRGGLQRSKSGVVLGVQRNESANSLISVDTTSGMDSCWTMDSVNLRKTQLIADPLEAGTYHSLDESFANHEDSMSNYSMNPSSTLIEYVEYRPAQGLTEYDGESVCTMEDLGLQNLDLNGMVDQGCDVSFFSQESGDLSDSEFGEVGENKLA